MRPLSQEERDKINALIEVTLSKQESFFQQSLIVSSTLLGIVISLHSTSSQPLCIRPVFLLALVLLSSGVLANLIAVFDFLQIREQARKVYLDEVNNARQNHRPTGPVMVLQKKRMPLCRKVALVGFAGGVVLLTLYSILAYFMV